MVYSLNGRRELALVALTMAAVAFTTQAMTDYDNVSLAEEADADVYVLSLAEGETLLNFHTAGIPAFTGLQDPIELAASEASSDSTSAVWNIMQARLPD